MTDKPIKDLTPEEREAFLQELKEKATPEQWESFTQFAQLVTEAATWWNSDDVKAARSAAAETLETLREGAQTAAYIFTGLREFLREVNVGLPVTKLAKWKTAFQMTALAMMLFRDLWIGWSYCGEMLLWVAAVLTFITGYQYYQRSLEYVRAEEAKKLQKQTVVVETVALKETKVRAEKETVAAKKTSTKKVGVKKSSTKKVADTKNKAKKA